VEALDRYFRTQAGQDARRHIAAPFVLMDDDDRVVGYYTLSSTSVALADLPASVTKRVPRYPTLPATLLGRLAVDRRQQGQGLGRLMLADALHRVWRSEIASFAVIVDAKDEAAARFYAREGFMPFPDRALKLFMQMETVASLFD
jgi:GNAT superfamily N-acetyltransferase